MKRVVIVGMGFGGLSASHVLANSDLDVLVIDRQNFHLFQPLLYQVATATLEQESIAHSIRAMVRKWPNVNFELTEVQKVDLDGKQVVTADGPVPYDYLIVAAGSATNFFGNKSLQEAAFDLKELDSAVALRNHILNVYEQAAKETDPARQAALMTFVIVGGGPTGVEFSGALAELTRNVLSKDFPRLPVKKTRIILVQSGDSLLEMFPPRLRTYALRRLRRMGVEVRFKSRVTDATAEKVVFKDGTELPSHTVFWAAGVKAAPLSDAIDVPRQKNGTIPVEADLTLKGHPEVFIIGDMAYREQDGTPLPQVAQVAMQGGDYAAKAILRREKGEAAAAPFHYFDKGSMAVIGRNAAVAYSFGIPLQGFIAWLGWLMLHVYYLIGFRNRLMTMLNWGISYFSADQQVRLITAADVKRTIQK